MKKVFTTIFLTLFLYQHGAAASASSPSFQQPFHRPFASQMPNLNNATLRGPSVPENISSTEALQPLSTADIVSSTIALIGTGISVYYLIRVTTMTCCFLRLIYRCIEGKEDEGEKIRKKFLKNPNPSMVDITVSPDKRTDHLMTTLPDTGIIGELKWFIFSWYDLDLHSLSKNFWNRAPLDKERYDAYQMYLLLTRYPQLSKTVRAKIFACALRNRSKIILDMLVEKKLVATKQLSDAVPPAANAPEYFDIGASPELEEFFLKNKVIKDPTQRLIDAVEGKNHKLVKFYTQNYQDKNTRLLDGRIKTPEPALIPFKKPPQERIEKCLKIINASTFEDWEKRLFSRIIQALPYRSFELEFYIKRFERKKQKLALQDFNDCIEIVRLPRIIENAHSFLFDKKIIEQSRCLVEASFEPSLTQFFVKIIKALKIYPSKEPVITLLTPNDLATANEYLDIKKINSVGLFDPLASKIKFFSYFFKNLRDIAQRTNVTTRKKQLHDITIIFPKWYIE